MSIRTVLTASAALLMSGCGGGLSGEYGSINEINGRWDTLFTFKGSQVEVSMMGQTKVGTYTLTDGKVYITIGPETDALKLDGKGCIEGGFLFGTSCKKR